MIWGNLDTHFAWPFRVATTMIPQQSITKIIVLGPRAGFIIFFSFYMSHFLSLQNKKHFSEMLVHKVTKIEMLGTQSYKNLFFENVSMTFLC